MSKPNFSPTLSLLWVLTAMTVAIAASGCGAVEAPPVEVLQRDSLLGIGKILIVRNPGEEALTALEFRFENPNGDVKNFALERLDAGEEIEVGWKKLDGFEVSDSAEVRVRAEGFGLPLVLDLSAD